MSVSWMTIRDLEYLRAVAQLEHFGRAAEACHVSQPALSTQIKKLEEQLGVVLFERSKRRVAITATGRRVVEQAARILEEAEKLPQMARLGSEPLADTFRLGAIATLGPYVFPRILRPLKKRFPEMDLRLKEGLTDGLLEDLRAGRVDAILASRTFDERGFLVETLFDEPFAVLLPKGHELAAKKTVRVADLRSDQMVLLEDGHCLRDEALETCPSNRRGQVREFHATSLETLKYLVANGAGYTLMPSLALEKINPQLLEIRKIESARPVARQIVLVGRANSARKSDIEALANWLRQEARKGGALERDLLIR